MEDKTFELLTKMYSEFSDRLSGVENRLGGVENRLNSVEGHITRLEIEHGQKLDALFDSYINLHEKQIEHDKRFDQSRPS